MRRREPEAIEEQKHTKRSVRAAIDAAEPELRFCWTVVEAIASGVFGKTFGHDLLNFQPRLFDAIEALEEVYRAIKQEERRLIGRKASLNLPWFRRQMASLAARTTSIKEALAIARSIGDGFAWFFYQDERDLIAEHLKLQRQPLLPPKMGRFGERFGLQQMQGIDQKLVLYHGTTTFLRLGDISLVDLRRLRVTCIGEIKTAQVSEREVEISISFVAGAMENLPVLQAALSTPFPAKPTKLSPAMEQRKKRQLDELGNALSKFKVPSELNANLPGEFLFDALDSVVARSGRRRFVYEQASDSIVFGALRIGDGRPLSALLTRDAKRDFSESLGDVPKWAMKIIRKGSRDNAMYVGSIAGGATAIPTTAETVPIAMWPASAKTLREMVFGNVVVVTLFNPAPILHVLRQQGFEIAFKADGSVSASRDTGNRRTELGNLSYFFNLVRFSLLSETSVIAMIERMLEVGDAQYDANGPLRMNIRPLVSMRPPPRKRG